MAIHYYPDHVQKKNRHVVEVLSRIPTVRSEKGTKDLTSTPLAQRFTPLVPVWNVQTITLKYSGSTSKTYSVNIETGRGIIAGLNDSLWIAVGGSGWAERIVIAPGFYDGTALSAAVKAALDANSVFSGLSLTFTVAYSASTDKFTITPSSGTIQYFNVCEPQIWRRNSTAGHVLGFTVDQDGNSLVSDTLVPGLGNKTVIAGGTDTTVNIVLTAETELTVDEAISLDSATVGLVVDWMVNYEVLEP